MRQTLADAKDELTAAKAAKEAEAKRIIEQRAEIAQAISGIVSIEKMMQLASIMAKNHSFQKKSIFLAAQEEASAIHFKMKSAGWRSEALVTLLNANINRPDRDGVGNIPVSAWYAIKRIEKPKED